MRERIFRKHEKRPDFTASETVEPLNEAMMDSKQHGRKGKRPVFWVPESFHPEDTLPPRLVLQCQSAYYLMHAIIVRIAFGDRDAARLKMEYLRNVMGRRTCDPILHALIASGDIRRTGGYTTGRNAYGYLPGEQYEQQRLRQFQPTHPELLERLEHVYAEIEARLTVWRRQPKAFFREAVIDMDGTLVVTTGECKEGMDISYKGTWGYHPLLVTLANTGEVLSLVNRSGNRPSEEGAAAEADRAIAVCRRGGFRRLRMRGDTAFSQTEHLDRWDEAKVLFQFGYQATPNLQDLVENLPKSAWKTLHRPSAYEARRPGTRPPAAGETTNHPTSRVSASGVEERTSGGVLLPPDEVPEVVPHDRGPQEHLSRERGASLAGRHPVLLLHHQRPEADAQ